MEYLYNHLIDLLDGIYKQSVNKQKSRIIDAILLDSGMSEQYEDLSSSI